MARPSTLQDSYRLGMKRDFAREQLPQGAVWNLVDFLPEVANSRLRRRGGYGYASQDITSVQGTADHLRAGIWAPYGAGTSILVWDEDGRVYEVESTTATENIGASVLSQCPAFYSDMVVSPGIGAAPSKITRSGGTHTIASLGGSPPQAANALVHKDVLWLLSSSANPDRIWFSAAGNPESWDTTNKWLDMSFPITGGVALSNAVLVFMNQRTGRIRGSIPPPDSDFIVDDPLFDVGCTDARSIAKYRDKAIWANAQGLYITDGTALEDLTKLCGMKSWWRDVMLGRDGFATGSTYETTNWRIAGGVYGDYYFYSIMNNAVEVDSGFIDLTSYTWVRMKNLDSRFFFSRPFAEELFFCRWQNARLGTLSPIFNPLENATDADGGNVMPLIELPYFEGELGLKTFRRLYLGYDVRGDGVIRASYVDTPEETAYTALTPDLTATSQYTRAALPLDFSGYGIGIKVEQVTAGTDTRLYGVELEAISREGSRGLT